MILCKAVLRTEEISSLVLQEFIYKFTKTSKNILHQFLTVIIIIFSCTFVWRCWYVSLHGKTCHFNVSFTAWFVHLRSPLTSGHFRDFWSPSDYNAAFHILLLNTTTSDRPSSVCYTIIKNWITFFSAKWPILYLALKYLNIFIYKLYSKKFTKVLKLIKWRSVFVDKGFSILGQDE